MGEQMDPAEEIELRYKGYQKPMNDVIDKGDSDIQQMYHNATVFLTGGSGFLGKQLIEKLFRSCEINKIYVLIRSKKGKSIEERLETLLQDPVYAPLRSKKPDFANKLVPVEGDAKEIRLGLNDHNWTKLTEEVDTIFHAAATVLFEAPIREATFVNVRGTREIIDLAKKCSKLKTMVHVSTAYSHATPERIDKDVLEQFYPTPMPPDLLISMAEQLDEKKLNSMDKDLIQGWPNTYTFTKAVAEELIRTSGKDLPISVVRPPIVISTYCEPVPGWIDPPASLMGPTGVILGALLGVLHTLYIKRFVKLAVAPVDYTNNAIIAAGWDSKLRKKNGERDIPIYAVTDCNNCFNSKIFRPIIKKQVHLASDKAVYYCCSFETHNKYLYKLTSYLFHYIPAYIVDAILYIIGKQPKPFKYVVGVYKLMDKLITVYDYFNSNEWMFRNYNLVAMRNRMSEIDKKIYNFDISTIDFSDFLIMWGLGVRKYVVKDGINKSHVGRKKQRVFCLVHWFIVVPLYCYLLWTVVSYFGTFIRFFTKFFYKF